ncbi:MAG: D-alanine--D-alanine ligase [Castellaniella sp.]|uniref:D-alanine--D-alanine ligase n=1 Tax=Castellaniella sp. TaxID=1955812 RepID=UPI003C74C346
MSNAFGKVGVLYGGLSGEREVSLMSGAGVCAALRESGIDAHLFDTGRQSLADLAAAGFDRVFIALHGRFGEDGTIQGALELLGIPYTGSGLLASSLAMDKIATKRLWLQHDLPTPRFAVLDCQSDPSALAGDLGLPLIVKPPHEGSTLGVTRVQSSDQLPQALALACEHDDRVLAEQFIQGRELTVPILGSGDEAHALPVIEIIAPQGNYDYEHKYVSNDTRYVCPADLPEALSRRIQDLSVQAYRALGCEGWGRADVMLDAQNQPWLLEMNTSPGMTSHSLVPMGAKALGMTYAQLCVAILATARCKVRRPAAD